MRVGVVTYDFFPLIGGIGRHTHLMYCQLREAGLLFFSPAENSLPDHVRIDFAPVRLLKQAGVSLWLHLNALSIIADYRLERLNVHSGAGGVLLIRRLPIPVTVTCHHTYWQQYTHLPAQFWKRIFYPFEKRTYRLADRIVCVSEDSKRVLIERYGIEAGKIRVIYNAVDTDKFFPLERTKVTGSEGACPPCSPHGTTFTTQPASPAPCPPPAGGGGTSRQNTVLYLGRVDKRKGIDFLIESMPLVLREVPEARLIVGGKGSYLEKMKALVRKLDMAHNVSFLGFVPDEELNALYNRAQCFVVPSVFEGFGITAIEALAAGTRVVGSEVDGLREVLKNPEYGRMVRYGDRQALADAIVAELRDPRRAQGLPPEFGLERFKESYLEMLQG